MILINNNLFGIIITLSVFIYMLAISFIWSCVADKDYKSDATINNIYRFCVYYFWIATFSFIFIFLNSKIVKNKDEGKYYPIISQKLVIHEFRSGKHNKQEDKLLVQTQNDKYLIDIICDNSKYLKINKISNDILFFNKFLLKDTYFNTEYICK